MSRAVFSRRLILVILASLACWTPVSHAKNDTYEWTGVERIVAIGDVHGAYDNLVAILQTAGLIDEKLRWIGGKTHLVQNGDIVDRGPESRKAMDLLMKLQKPAEKAGGKVHVLIGNHEAMNIVGILALVSDEEYKAFADKDSRKVRERRFDVYFDDLRKNARSAGESLPNEKTEWKKFRADYPLGWFEHRKAFSSRGRYGRWILENPVAIKINDTVFSHGDWSAEFSEIGIAEVNRRIRDELADKTPVEEGLTFRPKSPLQNRGLASVPLNRRAQDDVLPEVERVLENLGAKRMVVGHTLTAGVVEPRYGGKLYSIDTGMLSIYHGGHQVALEIKGDEVRAIHPGGSVPVPNELYEPELLDYFKAAEEVDPDNMDVLLKIVDVQLAEGQLAEARPFLERLFERPEYAPFRYRQTLGNIYMESGETEKASEHYLAYIDGLRQLSASGQSSPNLLNMLARFCIEKNLRLELAQEAVTQALEARPESLVFKLTAAKLELAHERYAEALRVLEEVASAGEPSYDLHYLTGLAHLGDGEPELAREAFEQAVAADSGRSEAREALKKLDGEEPAAA